MKGLFRGLPGWIQYPLPQHLISRAAFLITRIRVRWFKNALIRWFVRAYDVDMSEAARPAPEAYASFNEFFTRALEDGARPPTAAADALGAPVDGELASFGALDDGQLVQAKGHRFTVAELLGGDAGENVRFERGPYATFYLAPRAYHRVHLPFAGRLSEMIFVPGRLFSVNDATARTVPRLFARNERVVTVFETSAGPLAVVLVGALCVGSIETVWAGQVTPGGGRVRKRWEYPESGHDARHFARNAEIGRFNMGSTVIVLMSGGAAEWNDDLHQGRLVRVNEPIGRVIGSPP